MAVVGAFLLPAIPLLPYAHLHWCATELESATGTAEIASAMDRLDRYGGLGRREIHRVFFESTPAKQLRMEGLSIERRGSSILEEISKDPSRWRRDPSSRWL